MGETSRRGGAAAQQEKCFVDSVYIRREGRSKRRKKELDALERPTTSGGVRNRPAPTVADRNVNHLIHLMA